MYVSFRLNRSFYIHVCIYYIRWYNRTIKRSEKTKQNKLDLDFLKDLAYHLATTKHPSNHSAVFETLAMLLLNSESLVYILLVNKQNQLHTFHGHFFLFF